MTPSDITTFIGVVVAIISSVVVPWVLRRRARSDIADATDLASWQGIVATLKEEREDVRSQMKAVEAKYEARILAMEQECRKRMRAVEVEFTAKIAVLAAENVHQEAEIARQKAEIADLSVRLARQTPPPTV